MIKFLVLNKTIFFENNIYYCLNKELDGYDFCMKEKNMYYKVFEYFIVDSDGKFKKIKIHLKHKECKNISFLNFKGVV